MRRQARVCPRVVLVCECDLPGGERIANVCAFDRARFLAFTGDDDIGSLEVQCELLEGSTAEGIERSNPVAKRARSEGGQQPAVDMRTGRDASAPHSLGMVCVRRREGPNTRVGGPKAYHSCCELQQNFRPAGETFSTGAPPSEGSMNTARSGRVRKSTFITSPWAVQNV
jgi:hypothetical protein|eukprot:COSAG01_NODE_4371_length_5089_cov_51.610220_8_plen_170_part_00